MSQEQLKIAAAEAALEYIEPGAILGVGTGSTVNYFIDALTGAKAKLDGVVASSLASAQRLEQNGLRLLSLDESGDLPLYVDGADEATRHLQLTKGGGGALTGEKIVAAASETFVCIIDQSKMVDVLGGFPLPVEVIPLAKSYVARELVKLGGKPELREGFISDHGNPILDVKNLDIVDPVDLESRIDGIAGVVTNGLFARRGADLLLIGTDSGVERLEALGA